MAQLFYIDLTPLPTQKERCEVFELLERSGFDVQAHWIVTGKLRDHRAIDYTEAFWSYNDEPRFPTLPSCLKIIRKG